jgi:hypothetical protein
MSIDIEPGQRRRRRVRLTPTRSIPIPLAGERAGEGPLTLGQLHIYLGLSGDQFYAILCVELPVPAMVSVDEVADAVAVLVARHESLRTTYVPGDPPRQRVAATGVQMLEVCSLGEGQWGPQDRPAVADALVRWLRESPDPTQPPLRVAVAVAPDTGDQVIACAAAFSHLVVDHGSIEIIQRELADLLGDPARRQLGQPGHQPLDQAELEATPAEQRRADAALEHLREQLWRRPHCLYALPGTRSDGQSLAVELSSVAAALAVRQVAARTRTSRSAIVLAAVCAVVARRANYPELALSMMCNNRFDRHLANYVGPLAQGAFATVEIGDRSFDQLAGHSWTSVMEASRHGRYDRTKRGAIYEQIQHERGLHFSHDPLFNSLVSESWSGLTAGIGFQPADTALTRTELRWRPIPNYGTSIRFTLNQIDGCLRLDGWSADTGRIPRAELESVLLAVERLLVAAGRGDVPGDRMPELIGLAPIAATPDRLLVDNCWIDLADVQRLVAEVVSPAHVFASAGGRELVAYLAATNDIHTPEQAHARCMAALERHPTAITPRHYVICRTAPADPADPTAWPTPLATGAGRSTSWTAPAHRSP